MIIFGFRQKGIIVKFLLFIIIFFSLIYADNYQDAIAKINRIRANSGVAKLRYDARLKRAAYRHARYLGVNRKRGHIEKRGFREYSGINPSDRIIRAGYHTKAVVENISFGEKSYSSSIDTLMATIYHRHGFLDFRVDSIGPARAGRRYSVFVYDMSLSSLDRLCSLDSRVVGGGRDYVYNICIDRNKKIPKSKFLNLIKSVEKKSKSIVKYPYNAQKGVLPRYIKERPNPIPYIVNAGYPISILFNPSYYKKVKLKSFTLKYLNGGYIKGRVLSRKNDRYKKLARNAFVFIPLSPLAKGMYEAHFVGVADGRRINQRWRFWVK